LKGLDGYFMITIKEIAKLSGVSYSTVSKALNDSPLVKKTTKQKILQIAEQHNYRKNILASQLVSGKSKLIGLALRDMGNPVFSHLAIRLHHYLQSYDYQMILTVASNGIELLSQLCVDGILYWGNMVSALPLVTEELEKCSVPAIILGAQASDKIPSIQIDRRAGFLDAIGYLYSRGHRRIGIIGMSQKEKLSGYLEALQAYKLEFNPDFILNANKSWEDGYAAAMNFRMDKGAPSAFIGINNLVTQGALRGFLEKGVKIPEQLSLIAYDDVQELEYADVPITAVGPRLDEIAELAARNIVSLINNQKVDSYIWIKPVLHERKSVGPYQSSC
jgi:LacI family transcriptional regulator